ncbi:hypothetical protein THAOC_05084 [Thalassiosira oceanica]|uniref:Uncharacterized protein n=1 Tax=Thalassiosira oceanica TaxID=159749 RepID=K0T874_THAOC|nr:hypothetical protein THAOC_05084 [Thalassiosira oceanica]|eukprot:EJK73299.1 hypothetical protein THAOC_05084 [Thalassiosira oceanica]
MTSLVSEREEAVRPQIEFSAVHLSPEKDLQHRLEILALATDGEERCPMEDHPFQCLQAQRRVHQAHLAMMKARQDQHRGELFGWSWSAPYEMPLPFVRANFIHEVDSGKGVKLKTWEASVETSAQISAEQWGAVKADEVAICVHGVCPLPMGMEREDRCK